MRSFAGISKENNLNKHLFVYYSVEVIKMYDCLYIFMIDY